jgi:hypothetical protein
LVNSLDVLCAVGLGEPRVVGYGRLVGLVGLRAVEEDRMLNDSVPPHSSFCDLYLYFHRIPLVLYCIVLYIEL